MTITLNGKLVTSKSTMNVLGVIFDSKLQWDSQVCHSITKSCKALCAIHKIKRYFTNKELLQVVTSNFYSVLYYGSEIWHIPSLKVTLKKKLLSSSALALKACTKLNCDFVSFENLHKLNMRGTPEQMMLYRHSLLLYKLYNGGDTGFEWQKLNQLQILTSRQTCFSITRGEKLRVGINALANHLNVLNGKIPLCSVFWPANACLGMRLHGRKRLKIATDKIPRSNQLLGDNQLLGVTSRKEGGVK